MSALNLRTDGDVDPVDPVVPPEMRSLIHGSTRATADEHENFLLNSSSMKIGSLNDGANRKSRAGLPPQHGGTLAREGT